MKTPQLTTPASNKYPQTVVVMTINAPAGEAFDYIAPIYLPHIFPGTALIPAIVDTSVNEGWNKAGLSRTVYFKDGTTSKETLLTYNEPVSFSYKNEQFTSKMLGALMIRLEGEWEFTDLKNGTTKITWIYRTIPKGFFSRIFIKYVLLKALHSMLVQALTIAKQDMEGGSTIIKKRH
ncbi:Polyketide cyclase / dehydrase and lipid transport [Chryseolinea serpens]|uniref:Polyketide cyclase / dehydrase and lipid transport n=1 Tax=Chryseolinea serpens TaxID=947013 RepID=A0A1M5TBD2_9BACT|nr:SRPBCC family protein [Chryseolinea serpens]SHH48029.1 Polyketide cyclase / dehydrase and lipid transport [Chryseolinea serpens]